MRKKSKERTSCETCAFYVYDDEYGAYLCDMNMDEDDYVRIMSDRYYQCPYYRNGDESNGVGGCHYGFQIIYEFS